MLLICLKEDLKNKQLVTEQPVVRGNQKYVILLETNKKYTELWNTFIMLREKFLGDKIHYEAKKWPNEKISWHR